MEALPILAKCVVAFFIAYLLGLGVIGMVRPRKVWPFLSSLGSTVTANTAEALVRAIVGAALMVEADSFPAPALFFVIGLFLVVSAAAMLVLFGAHRRFADKVMPRLAPHVRLYCAASFGLGVILWRLWEPAY